MVIISILELSVLEVFIIYIGVRLAIKPLLNNQVGNTVTKDEAGLAKFLDIGILTPIELEEVIKIYTNKRQQDENHNQFEKYGKVLMELREMNYFSYEQYLEKYEKLKKYYDIS